MSVRAKTHQNSSFGTLNMQFISHARTVEELRLEFLSDLRRRIDNLGAQKNVFAKGAEAKSRFDARINELEDQLLYWSSVHLAYGSPGPGRPPNKPQPRED